jgi:transposase
MITQEVWMDLRALARQGYNCSQIGAFMGLDRRTVKKHLQGRQPPVYQRPPRSSKRDPFRPLVEQWLARAPGLRATRIYDDLRTQYGFPGSYPIVQRLVRTLRPPRLSQAHPRFETAPGQQAQVDWSDEETSFGHYSGPLYAFHMALGYSRDAYVEYTDRQDLGTFWACHQHACTFFGGVPDELLYDRTKTVVQHSVGRRRELHPEAIAFAGQYGFTIHLGLPRHPATKGKVEKQVDTIREWFFRGRAWTDLADLNDQWQAWHLEVWLPHVNSRARSMPHRPRSPGSASRGGFSRTTSSSIRWSPSPAISANIAASDNGGAWWKIPPMRSPNAAPVRCCPRCLPRRSQ